MENNIKENVNGLIEELFELDDDISLKEDILKTCHSSTKHIHLTDLKRLRTRYNRKLELIKVARGR